MSAVEKLEVRIPQETGAFSLVPVDREFGSFAVISFIEARQKVGTLFTVVQCMSYCQPAVQNVKVVSYF